MDEVHTLAVLQVMVLLRERAHSWKTSDETFKKIVDRVLGTGSAEKIGGRHAVLDEDGGFSHSNFFDACSKNLSVQDWITFIDER
jgi:hypothetical protein